MKSVYSLLGGSLFLFILSLAAPNMLSAALTPKDGAIGPEEAQNPQPAEDDVILPMPCGGEMAFKVVGVQTEGYLWDLESNFGCDSCERQGQDYYDRRYSVAVSGPFAASDLPTAWRDKLSEASAGQYHYYLIGKYEVTNHQWELVMAGGCPAEKAALTTEDARPKTNISWFEAVDFSRQYTEWLLKNSPDSLPHFSGDLRNTGYLRLPTEIEWEYAARGGQAVSRPTLRNEEFFQMEPGAMPSDYAVFRSEGALNPEGLAAVGRRRPNPLGLYDTAGNAAEMVMNNFQFSLGGRLHGSAGGFVRKGGSFISALPEIMPGRREETAFFLADGANRNRDLGFRLVISGINTPAGERPQTLADEWRRFGEDDAYRLKAAGLNPLPVLDKALILSGTPEGQSALESLRGLLKDNNIAQERLNASTAEDVIRTALFLAGQIDQVDQYINKNKEILNIILLTREQAANETSAAFLRNTLEQNLVMVEDLSYGLEQSLDAALGFYHSNLDKSLDYPEALWRSQLNMIKAELTGETFIAQSMRRYCDIYEAHLARLRAGRGGDLSRAVLLGDLTGR